MSNLALAATNDVVRVLLVDDDEMYLRVLGKILNRDSLYTYELFTASTSAEALSVYRLGHFDLIIIDYNLPDTTGVQCLANMRADASGVADTPPAIICTANGSEQSAIDAIRADADDYLAKKDIKLESLHRSIHNAIAKHRLQSAAEAHHQQINVLNQQLERQNQEIKQFYHNVSHEVKTPLAAAREFVALVRDAVPGPVNAQQIEVLDMALASCDQLAQHFNDLTDIARLELGKLSLQKNECSVRNIVDRSVASCMQTIRERDGTLTITPFDDVAIIADENRLVQVLSNLVSNAIKYSSDSPAVTISITPKPDQVQFTVSDQGVGIAEQDLQRIFNRLQQATDTENSCLGAGLGLGLSIAKEIVSLHHGEILAESEIDSGSTFFFTIPVND
jgi:signal transduction histidine kinase